MKKKMRINQKFCIIGKKAMIKFKKVIKINKRSLFKILNKMKKANFRQYKHLKNLLNNQNLIIENKKK
jgi:hypothetical protein